MQFPELWIVAGPNGAGKTTAVQREPVVGLLPAVSFLNPDDRTLQKLKSLGYSGFADAPNEVQGRLFVESADEVLAEVNSSIDQFTPIGVETVLSSTKYQTPVEAVLRQGGVVGLLYVALSSPEIAKTRIAARVARGGHGVPEDRVAARWHRSLDLLPWFAKRATHFWVVDNSTSDPGLPLNLLASGSLGRLDYVAPIVFPEMLVVLNRLPR
jgi:predicted ABC-type ATPase